MKKTLISIAIIAALPMTANATGPAHDSGNSPVVATASAPYQTVTPEAHADEHIASTKYVIGAYNDAIAAVNKVADNMDGKQDRLVSMDDNSIQIDTEVVGRADIIDDMMSGNVTNTYLVSEAALVRGIRSQRAEVYTDWDDDTAKIDVAFKTVMPED